MVSHMMQVGEGTGKLDIIFTKISEFYNKEIDNALANVMSLMEPLIMNILGIGVGVMLAAVIMRVYYGW